MRVTEIPSGLQAHFIFCWKEFLTLPPLEQLREMVERIAKSEGLDLVDLEFKAGRSRSLLRIFIDKSGGVTLDDCESVSRQLSAVLDVEDLVKDAYVLEVSSPGLDRPFKTDQDYDRNLGRTVRIHYGEADEPRQVLGRLLEVNENQIAVEDRGKIHRIDREKIRRAHQDIILPGRPEKKKKHK